MRRLKFINGCKCRVEKKNFESHMTLNMIQAVNSLKFVDSCRSLSTGGQKLWNDHKIDESSRHMNGKITCQILYEDLGKRKMCMKFVPHSFTGTKEHGHNP
jgi:hypothetical protein